MRRGRELGVALAPLRIRPAQAARQRPPDQVARRQSASLRDSGESARGDIQLAVWRSIDAKMEAFDCRSDMRSLHDVYASAEERLRLVRSAFTPQP